MSPIARGRDKNRSQSLVYSRTGFEADYPEPKNQPPVTPSPISRPTDRIINLSSPLQIGRIIWGWKWKFFLSPTCMIKAHRAPLTRFDRIRSVTIWWQIGCVREMPDGDHRGVDALRSDMRACCWEGSNWFPKQTMVRGPGHVPFAPSVNLLHHPPWVWSLDWSGFLSDSVNKTSISAGRSYSFGLTAEHQQRVKWTSNLGEQIVPGLGPGVLVALLSWSICRTGDGTHAFSRLGWFRGVEENSCKHKQPLHSTPLVWPGSYTAHTVKALKTATKWTKPLNMKQSTMSSILSTSSTLGQTFQLLLITSTTKRHTYTHSLLQRKKKRTPWCIEL